MKVETFCMSEPVIRQCIFAYTSQAGPYYLTTMTVFNFLLPPIASMPQAFGKLLSDGIVDSYMQKELIECKALNWCRNIRSLSPMKNKGMRRNTEEKILQARIITPFLSQI